MSKYIKLETAIGIIQNEINKVKIENDYDNTFRVGLRLAKNMLPDLPTIEVSEDCISKHDIWKIIEDNAYWVRYNENSTEKGMTLTGINQALNECPPVIPTVSEDCISRANTIKLLKDNKNFINADPYPHDCACDLVEVAPSVTTEQSSMVGEWHRVSADKYVQHAYHHFRCSECGEDTIGEPNYCPNCGARMKGAENE